MKKNEKVSSKLFETAIGMLKEGLPLHQPKKSLCRRYIMTMVCLLLMTVMVSSGAYDYTGVLVSDQGQLDGTGFWVADNGQPTWIPSSIEWAVTYNGNSTWHYEYTLTVFRADVSHFILETSETFTYDNIFNVSYPGESMVIGTFSSGGGNPSMPA